MKYILTILTLSVLLTSCGEGKKNTVEKALESNNLETIRKKRAELVDEQQILHGKIVLLDGKISVLDTTKNVPLITTFKATPEEFNHVLELQGNVTTKDLMIITPEYSGILTHVYVKEGQRVSKGQSLGKIDDGGLSQQLAQQQIQTDLAQTTFERQKRLWDQKIGSEIQFLQAKSTYEGQVEAVNQIQQQIAKTIVKAPFSGTHRRRFIRGNTNVWNDFKVLAGTTTQRIHFSYFDYAKEYGRGEFKGVNGAQVTSVLNTIARMGVIDDKHFGGNSWHTPYGPVCLHEQYIAQLGVGINDAHYLKGYKQCLDFYRFYP